MWTALICDAPPATTLRCSTRLRVPDSVTLSSRVRRATLAVTMRSGAPLPPRLPAETAIAAAPATTKPRITHRHRRTRSAARSGGARRRLLRLRGAVSDVGAGEHVLARRRGQLRRVRTRDREQLALVVGLGRRDDPTPPDHAVPPAQVTLVLGL